MKKHYILIKTEDGQKGMYDQADKLVNGKVPVTMLNDQLQPKMKNNEVVRKLFSPDKLKPFGFIN